MAYKPSSVFFLVGVILRVFKNLFVLHKHSTGPVDYLLIFNSLKPEFAGERDLIFKIIYYNSHVFLLRFSIAEFSLVGEYKPKTPVLLDD